ncbi:MAG TPA: efflux transporter periplasmic adaptor subunit, partial [Rubrivivax sp.]|nr:efflux transporter periplasmic adaptor subunit [Rubrivivax sp.]
VDSQVDSNGRAMQVLAQVSNPDSLLKPGMFARPRVVFSVREAAVVVPEEALVPVGAKRMIFKVVQGPDGKPVAQRLEAQIGLRLPGKVEILSGLKAGDTVVTAGHARLMRGDNVPVRIVDLQAAAPQGGGSAVTGALAAGGAPGSRAASGVAGPARTTP